MQTETKRKIKKNITDKEDENGKFRRKKETRLVSRGRSEQRSVRPTAAEAELLFQELELHPEIHRASYLNTDLMSPQRKSCMLTTCRDLQSGLSDLQQISFHTETG